MARPSGPRTSEQSERQRGDTQQQSQAGGRQEAETERIARRAYERFEARGGEHGRDQEDWFAAEQDVTGR